MRTTGFDVREWAEPRSDLRTCRPHRSALDALMLDLHRLQETHLTLQAQHSVVRSRTQGVARVARGAKARLPSTIRLGPSLASVASGGPGQRGQWPLASTVPRLGHTPGIRVSSHRTCTVERRPRWSSPGPGGDFAEARQNSPQCLDRTIEEFCWEQHRPARLLFQTQFAMEELGTNFIKQGGRQLGQVLGVALSSCAVARVIQLTDDSWAFDPPLTHASRSWTRSRKTEWLAARRAFGVAPRSTCVRPGRIAGIAGH